jgi:hypothetical protein
MRFVKRKISTKSKVVTIMEEIPDCLVINWDQTGINYVPVSNWTMEKEGSRRVEVFGADDKWQITGVFACSMEGDLLLPQIINQKSQPNVSQTLSFPVAGTLHTQLTTGQMSIRWKKMC